ncbi:hypothetical protein [Candidatus Electronema sp. PJ]|uniref:hypothetical protein n=1 Tax=Candidatus Electronema sp. PJ TaxID=3401572 RepID=UPI003AA835FE
MKTLLLIWGTFCALGVILFTGTLAYKLGLDNKNSNAIASKYDVRYILIWCGLGEERIKEVLHSYVSARAFSGDHFDAHAIRLSQVKEAELTRNEADDGWFRGDQASGAVKDAVEFIEAWVPSEEAPWFPAVKELRSPDIYVFPYTIHYDNTRVTDAELIFVRPKDNMLFFVGIKT